MFVKLEGLWKMLKEFAPGTPLWTAENMPDMTGKVVIVTGGNTGIGYETVKGLLLKNATVYMGARSIPKAEAAIRTLVNETGNSKLFLLQMDLSDLPRVKQAAEEFQRKEKRLHLLINNAGVMTNQMDTFTAQGYDLQFGTNVIGNYLFSKLLIPLMEATAATLPPTDPVRIVELTSDAHLINATTFNLVDYSTLLGGEGRNKANAIQMYSQSKTGNILVSKARARLLTGKNIVSMSVNPGRIRSELNRQLSGLQLALTKLISYPTPMGAITSLYAATAPEAAKLNGEYLAPWARVKEPRSDHVDNIQQEDKLIAWMEEQLRINKVL